MGSKYRLWQSQINGFVFSFIGVICFLFLAPPVKAEVIREDNSPLSTAIGVPLYVWRDSSYQKPRAIFIAVHGSAQQGGSMNALANTLATSGCYVIAPDIRGHGRWQQSNHPQASSYDELVQSAVDLQSILKLVQHEYPKTNICCLGESIGVGIVLAAVTKESKRVKGLILCSAGVKPHLHNPLKLGPEFVAGMAHLVQPVDIRKYLGMYSSDDARVAQEMINDPLGKNTQTGLELVSTFNFLNQEPGFAENVPANIKVLEIQGEADQILEPSSAYKIFNALRTKKKTFAMIPGAGHVLVGTSFIKPSVLESIQTFLDENVMN